MNVFSCKWLFSGEGLQTGALPAVTSRMRTVAHRARQPGEVGGRELRQAAARGNTTPEDWSVCFQNKIVKCNLTRILLLVATTAVSVHYDNNVIIYHQELISMIKASKHNQQSNRFIHDSFQTYACIVD